MPFKARWSGNNASPSHIIYITITCHKTEGSDHITPVTVKTAPCGSVMFSTLWLCLSDRLSHLCLSVCPTLICLSLKSFSAQTTPQLCTNHIVQNHNNIFICLFFPSYKNLGATDKLFSNWQRRNTCCSQNSQSGILSPNSLKKCQIKYMPIPVAGMHWRFIVSWMCSQSMKSDYQRTVESTLTTLKLELRLNVGDDEGVGEAVGCVSEGVGCVGEGAGCDGEQVWSCCCSGGETMSDLEL